jgi:integrase
MEFCRRHRIFRRNASSVSGVGRPALPLGTAGKINVREIKPGTWRATAWFRDAGTGDKRPITASGSTEAAAERSLKEKLALPESASSSSAVTSETTVAKLAELFLSAPGTELAVQTTSRYAQTVAHTIVPALGGIRMRELTIGKVTTFLKTVAASSPSEARMSRSVLKKILEIAVDNDAIKSNYAHRSGVVIKDPDRAKPRALTFESAQLMFDLIKIDRTKTRPGPKSTKAHDDLKDILLIQLGAGGLRISEAAAIQVDDIFIEDGITLLRVHQAVVYQPPSGKDQISGKWAIPGHYRVQQQTKKGDFRVVALPIFAAEILSRRSATPGKDGLVFHASRTSGPLNLNNLRRTLRDSVVGSEFEGWASTHTMRRTIGTLVSDDPSLGIDTAMKVLGHLQRATTERSYRERYNMTPDVTRITGQFGGLALE